MSSNNPQDNQGPLSGARHTAEQQVDQAIDTFANKIPGGTQFSQQAKDAANGVLLNLENEGEKRLNDAGGTQGIFTSVQNMLKNVFGKK